MGKSGADEPTGRTNVTGAQFHGGRGGIHVGGNLDASVTANVGDAPPLRAAVDDLVAALVKEGLLEDPDLREASEELQAASREPKARAGLVRLLLRQIESHPATAGAAVAAALTAVQAALGG